MDTRVYIQDLFGNEVEVDTEIRNSSGDMIGVLTEGPDSGTAFVLPQRMVDIVEQKMEKMQLLEEDL